MSRNLTSEGSIRELDANELESARGGRMARRKIREKGVIMGLRVRSPFRGIGQLAEPTLPLPPPRDAIGNR